MELQELLSFYHVARLRSVSKAAEHMKIAQPTVTNHLKRLEKEFGVILFDRVKRPIQVTSDGRTFYESAKSVVEGIEALRIRMNLSESQGSFKLAAYPDLIHYYLPQVLKKFREEYPDVTISVLARPYAALINMALSGELDLALSARPLNDNPSLDFIELFKYNTVLITPQGHPLLELPQVTMEEIARWPLILLGRGTYTRGRLDQLLRQKGLRYNVALEMDNMECVKQYVEIGMGVAVGAEFGIRPGDEARLGIRSLDHIFPSASVGIITLRGKILGKAVHAFIRTLVTQLGALKSNQVGALEKSSVP